MTADSQVADTLDEPILATVVPPPPSPWQFGLKALMGLMVVCSVQFALMSYVGVMAGLGVAIALCGTALAVILLMAVVFVPSRTPLMERLDFIGIRLVVAITILLVGTILAGGGTAVFYAVTEIRTAVNLESDLGLATRRIEVWDSKGTHHALKVMVVVPGSQADRAGLKIGEVIVVQGTVSDFYQRMQESRGNQYSFNVAGPPVGGSIENLPKRQVTVMVPK
jgi:hypothetical protein